MTNENLERAKKIDKQITDYLDNSKELYDVLEEMYNTCKKAESSEEPTVNKADYENLLGAYRISIDYIKGLREIMLSTEVDIMRHIKEIEFN